MPEYAKIECSFSCPHCRYVIDAEVRFQWGRLPTWYKIGDKIKWRRTRSGAIVEPFTISWKYGVWNCGTPDITDLYVFDADLYAQDTWYPCPECSGVVFGVVVEIRGGVIKAVTALTEQEVRDMLGDQVEAAEIVVIGDDAKLTVRSDWFNPPLRITD